MARLPPRPLLLLLLALAASACRGEKAGPPGGPAGTAPRPEEAWARPPEGSPPPAPGAPAPGAPAPSPPAPTAAAPGGAPGAGTPPGGAPLVVHFFDVGQGDAALIRSPAGRTVLVDGGPPQADDLLLRRLPALVQGPLDLVVLTHPHLDHLGGLPRVLQGVGARRFLDPGFEQPSESYRDLLALLARLKIPLRQPTLDPARPGQPVTIGLGEGASLTVLWPRRPVEPFLANTRSDANANSVVMRLTHGNVHVLFTGDAEPDTEERLLELGAPLRAQVLKVGHHGSRWASSAPFLAQVRPEVAVISAGRGNDYGHPTPEALERLRAVGARVLRTDLAGELRLESDGTRVRVEPVGPAPPAAPGGGTPQAPAPAPGYTAYRGGPVFHRADCRAAAKWTPAQREDFSRREDAARGRRPAKDCDP